MPKYFDIHSHLNFPNYRDDFEEVIKRLRETDTRTIVIGTDLATSKEAVELAEKYEGIYAAIGVHPVDKKFEKFNKEEFEKLVKSKKVVLIGECGLDFFHAEKENDYERQKELFLAQIDFALQHDKPIMIHSRNAYEKLLEILQPFKQAHEKLRGNIHFFAGNLEQAEKFWNIGFSTSFTGVITFTRDYDEVIRNAPLERLMAETDAPFVAPVPYRGKRNEPSFVVEVVQKIAEIRGEDLETVRAGLVNNALRMIGY
jgi:TatD DNase family protein